ncbi:MAG: hypothetical protein BWY75_03143 [bacterium ADurb.Bin425]|nr:MAG: hypothetical protein BWY75_03143 [bacterium ADurb.Bin425]
MPWFKRHKCGGGIAAFQLFFPEVCIGFGFVLALNINRLTPLHRHQRSDFFVFKPNRKREKELLYVFLGYLIQGDFKFVLVF